MGIFDYMILAIVAIWFAAAIRSIIRKKGGCCGSGNCSGCCGSCQMGDVCRRKESSDKKKTINEQEIAKIKKNM